MTEASSFLQSRFATITIVLIALVVFWS